MTWPHGDALAVLGRAPTPEQGAQLSLTEIGSALKRGWAPTQHRRPRPRDPGRAAHRAARRPRRGRRRVRGHHPRRGRHHRRTEPPDRRARDRAWPTHFETHPDADIYLSLPGLGVVLGARVLGEFGDDPNRYTTPSLAKTTPEPHH